MNQQTNQPNKSATERETIGLVVGGVWFRFHVLARCCRPPWNAFVPIYETTRHNPTRSDRPGRNVFGTNPERSRDRTEVENEQTNKKLPQIPESFGDSLPLCGDSLVVTYWVVCVCLATDGVPHEEPRVGVYVLDRFPRDDYEPSVDAQRE